MGGMLSTRIGFRHAAKFGAFGSQQSSAGFSARLEAMVKENRAGLEGKQVNIATSERARPKFTKLVKSSFVNLGLKSLGKPDSDARKRLEQRSLFFPHCNPREAP